MNRQNVSGCMIGMCQERFAGCECESREKRYDRFIAVPRQLRVGCRLAVLLA
jgi:hypothetical protein